METSTAPATFLHTYFVCIHNGDMDRVESAKANPEGKLTRRMYLKAGEDQTCVHLVHFNKKSEPNYESRNLARREHRENGGGLRCRKHDPAACDYLFRFHEAMNAKEDRREKGRAQYREAKKRRMDASTTHETLSAMRGTYDSDSCMERAVGLGDVLTMHVGSDRYGYVVTERWIGPGRRVIKIGLARADAGEGIREWVRYTNASTFLVRNRNGAWVDVDPAGWAGEGRPVGLHFGYLQNYHDPHF